MVKGNQTHKNLYFFILLVLFGGLKAQDSQNRVFTLRPALGFNGCQIHGDSYSGYDKLGGFTGVAVNSRLTERKSFELGFYFTQKGARHNQNPKIGDYSFYRVNLNYLEVPLLLHYRVSSAYYFCLGPSLAYLISYYEDINNTNVTGLAKFNKLEGGINIGLGRRIKEKIFIELRSSNSLTPIRDYGKIASLVFYPNPVARFFNKGLYNNILTLLFTYKLDLKRKSGE